MEENGMMETSNYDDDDEKTTKSKLMGWILNFVVTGVVISSVPLLVVISALSLPFGVVFASYACTDKLMSKLLEFHQTVLLQDQEQREMRIDEMVEEIKMKLAAGDRDELLLIKVEENSSLEEKRRHNEEEIFREEKGLLIQKKIEASNLLSFSPVIIEVKLGPGEKQSPEVVPVQENNDSKHVSAINLLNDVGDTDSSLEKEEKAVGVLKEMFEAQSVKVHDVCSEIKNIDESNTSTAGHVLASEIDVGVLANDDGKIEHRTVTIYNDPAGENYNQSKMMISGDSGEYTLEITGMRDQLKHDQVIPGDACAVDGGMHSDEGLFGGEEIWKKIEAIRVIVGYKAPRSASYVEELKALYLITGIEPPQPSLSDYGEFHNKLCFLMYVIGLK